MAHLVEQMFSVNELPWHYGETADRTRILGRNPNTWEEIRELGGFTWNPIEGPVYGGPEGVDEHGNFFHHKIDGFKTIRRDDSDAVLAVAKQSWQIIDHDAMGEIATALLGQDGIIAETGGVLDEGRKVWALFRVDDPYTITGDNSQTIPFVALLNAHDGESAFRAIPTSVRVVCGNTWHFADVAAQRQQVGFTMRHTKGWKDQMGEAVAAIKGARAQAESYRELAEQLTGIPISATQREAFVQLFMPLPAAKDVVSKRVAQNIETSRDQLRLLFASETNEHIKGSAYGLVQAAGEYLDHTRRYKTRDSYVNRTLLSSERLKGRAVKMAREAALV